VIMLPAMVAREPLRVMPTPQFCRGIVEASVITLSTIDALSSR